MSTLNELANCVNQNDAMSFLICYLKLLNQNESLQLPQSTNIKDLEMEWKDSVPSNCKNGLPIFYENLSTLWLSLLKTASTNESSNLIDLLLTTLEHNQQKSHIQEGAIVATRSDDYILEKNVIDNPLPKKIILTNIKNAISKKQIHQFLEHYCYLCLIDQNYPLPQKSALESIEQEWGLIINTHFPSQSINIKDLSKAFFNLIHTHGIPNTKQIILLFYKALSNKNKSSTN